MGVDPLAEKYANMGGYVYCANNPVRFVDPDGMRPWPLEKLFKGFGRNHSDNWHEERKRKDGSIRLHQGVDMNHKGGGDTDLGAPIVATHDGVIKRIRTIKQDKDGGGNRIVITSKEGTVSTSYMHLSEIADLEEGDVVNEGQIIGKMGGSGSGTTDAYTSHLHYELRINDESANPIGADGNLIDPQLLLKNSEKNSQPTNPSQDGYRNFYFESRSFKVSDWIRDSKAPILNDVGEILNFIGL